MSKGEQEIKRKYDQINLFAHAGKTTFADWLKGWERTFFYTGHALAIKYVDNTAEVSGQL
ncbi:MAG: hypothetical protein LBU85_08410 [Treponema sp.]|nr:hypothetical protein [Treponema sp.]